MRRHLLILALFLLFSCLLPQHASAEKSGVCGDDLSWMLTDDGILTIQGSGAMTDYSWGTPAPWGKKITQVMLAENVTRIGNHAFTECMKLTSVTLPNSLTSIGDEAFYYCTELVDLSLPNSLNSIGRAAFSGCESLTEISLPNGITEIPDSFLSGCYSLSSITLPNGLSSIGRYAFSYCYNLFDITIPSSTTSIGYGAFNGCSGMKEIFVPEGIADLSVLFDQCSSLTSVHLPSTLRSIVSNFFCGTAISEVYFNGTKEEWDTINNVPSFPGRIHFSDGTSASSSVTGTIGNLSWAIDSDGLLTISGAGAMKPWSYPWRDYRGRINNVIIHEGVASIEDAAFSGFSSLETLIVPASVDSIGAEAFSGIENAGVIILPEDHPYFKIEDGALLSRDGTRLLYAFPGNIGSEYTIPSGVTTVADYAFYYCENLEKLIISDGVEDFGIQQIYSLSEISIPKTMVSSNLELPHDIQRITISPENPVWRFEFGCLYNIETGDLWQYFENIAQKTNLTIPEGVKRIKSFAFQKQMKLTSLYIPDGVTDIEEIAFDCCPLLQRIRIPRSVTSIGEQALQSGITIYCYADSYAAQWAAQGQYQAVLLDENGWTEEECAVVLPEQTIEIQAEAFMGTGGSSYYIPFGVTSIGSKAFANLQKSNIIIMIPSTVTSIADDAFIGSDVTLIITYKTQSIDYMDAEILMDWAETHGIRHELSDHFWGNG